MMIKKSFKIFKTFNFIIFIVLSSFPLVCYAKKEPLSLKILPTFSPFTQQYEEDDEDDNGEYSHAYSIDFYNAISTVHPPVLVNYDGLKSILLFVPANPKDPNKENHHLVYNFNLGNFKLNEVGTIFTHEILSIFSYNPNEENAMIFVLQKNKSGEETLYSNVRFSVLKEEGGLYIQSFKTDRISIAGLDNCIDGGIDYLGNTQICKYKDASSIRVFFDNIIKNKRF
jgi:hypothetical protein